MELIGITDDRRTAADLCRLLTETEPYIDHFILREKSKSDDELSAVIEQLRRADFPLAKLIIHARPRLAERFALKRVHLQGFGCSLIEMKQAHPSLQFGISVHSYEEAVKAEQDGAQWVLYGHLFNSSSKPGEAPRGTDEAARIARRCAIPVYAVGGIKPHHLPRLQQLGLSGAAVLSRLEHAHYYRKGWIDYAEND